MSNLTYRIILPFIYTIRINISYFNDTIRQWTSTIRSRPNIQSRKLWNYKLWIRWTAIYSMMTVKVSTDMRSQTLANIYWNFFEKVLGTLKQRKLLTLAAAKTFIFLPWLTVRHGSQTLFYETVGRE